MVFRAACIAGRVVVCLAAAVVALALTSCDPCRRCVTPAGTNTTTYVHDTVTVTVYARDTVEVVRLLPGRASVSVPEADTARAETAYAAAIAYLRGRSIILEISNKDTAAALVQHIERLTERLRESSQTIESVVIKRERYVPGVVKAFAAIGSGVTVGLLFFAVSAFFRRKF